MDSKQDTYSKYCTDHLLDTMMKLTNDIIFYLDADYKILYLNKMAETVFQISSKEAVGESFLILCEQKQCNLLLDTYRDSVLIRGETFTDILVNIGDVALRWAIAPLINLNQINKQNNIEYQEGFLLMGSDHNEYVYKDQIEKYETLIANMPCNVYWMDENCIMVGCNDNVLKMTNLTHTEFVGKTYEELEVHCNWPAGLAMHFKDGDIEVLRTGLPKVAIEDPLFKNSNGEFLYLLTTRVPLKNKLGKIVGVAGISTDITERKLAEEREKIAVANAATQTAIAKTEAALRQAVMVLTGSIAHDLRTPLGTANLMFEFIRKRMPILLEAYTLAIDANLPLSEKIDNKHMDHLVKVCDTLYQAVIDDMYAFINTTLKTLKSGLKKDLEKDDLIRCSMWHCLHNTVFRYPYLEGQRELVTWDQQDFAFMGNEIMMTRVFSNLIKNSLEQITKNGKGTITITTEQGEDVNKIRFKDTAGGASPEIVDSIFEGYKTTKAKGTGIGLAFCRITLEKFGGSITCNSVENEFIEFTITLPNPGKQEG